MTAALTDRTVRLKFRTRVRAVFISDVHLGTRTAQADQLLLFLKQFEADTIYLVGDIIDFWKVRRGPHWAQSHNDVLQKLMRRARKGTRLVYIPGNHEVMGRRQEDSHLRMDLEAALERLPETSRAVVWLHDVEGYTHEEIAKMMGKTPSFSKSQLARAHARLRRWLGEELVA